ncbi:MULTISPECIES: hypothetical protein [Arthrobacter]|uniref:Uncharacterized protein n=2 Tax=Arthrobacter TaxID=1663 RepID=A0ABU9KH88_9MICC|nr:hypothetical protein [Arthrobacter sp. YJM1]MDP5225723.1 hypothetical protein [Arthrobacter sp. YJM1]
MNAPDVYIVFILVDRPRGAIPDIAADHSEGTDDKRDGEYSSKHQEAQGRVLHDLFSLHCVDRTGEHCSHSPPQQAALPQAATSARLCPDPNHDKDHNELAQDVGTLPRINFCRIVILEFQFVFAGRIARTKLGNESQRSAKSTPFDVPFICESTENLLEVWT